jgi:hypothetical protein
MDNLGDFRCEGDQEKDEGDQEKDEGAGGDPITFEVGECATLRGLKSSPELNGRAVIVTKAPFPPRPGSSPNENELQQQPRYRVSVTDVGSNVAVNPLPPSSGRELSVKTEKTRRCTYVRGADGPFPTRVL